MCLLSASSAQTRGKNFFSASPRLGGSKSYPISSITCINSAGISGIGIREIAGLADTTVVVMVPEAGDEVQTMKAGLMVRYALLNAEKYFAQGKKSSWFKRFINPQFSFAKHYIFQLGFLDGWEGLLSARMTAFYTFLKYARLHELWKGK